MNYLSYYRWLMVATLFVRVYSALEKLMAQYILRHHSYFTSAIA